MNNLYLFNTLTRQKELFKPAKNKQIGLYTCGPTVYNYAHLGNLRTYIFEDILKRTLLYNGYQVKHVMNITDVGHLTNDRDMGEDKVEMEARKEHKTAKEIAEFYTETFKKDLRRLNIEEPTKWAKATDYIPEQIDLVKKLEKKGFTYRTSDGIYFDTSKFKNYNRLSNQPLTQLKEGARVEKNPEKKNPTDFALWKFSPNDSKRQMEWPSPWGTGFPGWHLECAAISLATLKKQRDIHCGGIDHIDVHHTNEIAEYETAYNEQFFPLWMHGAFLNIAGGKKMAKSEGNFLTLDNAVINKGYDPLAYRLMCLGAHYRTPLTWNETAIKNFNQLWNIIKNKFEILSEKVKISYKELEKKYKKKYNDILPIGFKNEFEERINDDLDTAIPLSYFLDVLNDKSMDNEDRKYLLLRMDQVLGLSLNKIKPEKLLINDKGKKLINDREKARAEKNWKKSDELRKQINELGYIVEDTKDGQRLIKK